MGSTKQ